MLVGADNSDDVDMIRSTQLCGGNQFSPHTLEFTFSSYVHNTTLFTTLETVWYQILAPWISRPHKHNNTTQ